MPLPFCLEKWETAQVLWCTWKNLLHQVHFQPVFSFSEHSTQWILSQIFFKYGGSGSFSVKSTRAGGDIVATATGDGSVDDDAGGGKEYGSVADADAGMGVLLLMQGMGVLLLLKGVVVLLMLHGMVVQLDARDFLADLERGADGALRL